MWANLLILFPSNKGGHKWHFQFYPHLGKKKAPKTKPLCAESWLIKFFVMVGRQKLSRFLPSVVQNRTGFFCNFVIRTKRRNHINQR